MNIIKLKAYIKEMYAANPKQTIVLGIFAIMVLGTIISALVG